MISTTMIQPHNNSVTAIIWVKYKYIQREGQGLPTMNMNIRHPKRGHEQPERHNIDILGTHEFKTVQRM